MADRPRLTATIITLNEAPRLSALLPALDWVDEIVVVDSGSTDDTCRLAAAHGCRVVCQPLTSYAAQRNRALELARGEWVLSIDADERPGPAFAATVDRQIAVPHAPDGFRVPIRSRIFGQPFRFSGTQDDAPVRLVRRARARWVGHVHERLLVPGRTPRLATWLEHETLPSVDAFLAKMNRYTALEAAARLAAGRPPRRSQRWLDPPREVFRRLIWKQGIWDGPPGWLFALLSGLSAWVAADRHARAWDKATALAPAAARATAAARLQAAAPLHASARLHAAARLHTAAAASAPAAISPAASATRWETGR